MPQEFLVYHVFHVYPSPYKSSCNNFLHVCLLTETVSSEVTETLCIVRLSPLVMICAWDIFKNVHELEFGPWLINLDTERHMGHGGSESTIKW